MKGFKILPIALLAATASVHASQTQPIQLQDIMQFESLQKPVIADNGSVVAVEAKPDRGNSRSIVKQLETNKTFDLVGASKPQTSADGRFVIATMSPDLFSKETAKKEDKLSDALVLLDTQTGTQQQFEDVKSASFSEDGQFLVVWFSPPKEDKDAEKKESEDKVKVEDADVGAPLSVIALANKQQLDFQHVTQFVINSSSEQLALAINDAQAKQHQLLAVELKQLTTTTLLTSATDFIGELAISPDASKLAFTYGEQANKRWGREYQLGLYDLNNHAALSLPQAEKNWTLNQHSNLNFSQDNERLFFGRVPSVNEQASIAEFEDKADVLNIDIITGKRNLRVWHGEDKKIKPQEVKEYQDELARTYLAVLHVKANRIVQLADQQVPDIELGEQKRYLIGSSDLPYQKMITWAGFYRDIYLVDINTGNKLLILPQQSSYQMPTLSPNARFMAYFKMGDVFIFDIANGRKINLTQNIATPFANEDHDYPSPAPGYGFGPWIEDGSSVIVYDKYDAWQFNSTSHSGFMLTNGEGRKTGTQFRLVALADNTPFQPTISNEQTLLFHGYSHINKADQFYLGKEGIAEIKQVTTGEKKRKILARAKNTETLVFSEQRYDLYPDLQVTELSSFENAKQITQLDKQRQAFAWGQAELVQWRDGDGLPADGVLIKPTNYQEGKQYPVLVYFYRFMSDRLHAFPDMKINHRPNFAWYADNGYAIFLPDIRFEEGYPGISAVKALTAGVQKIIDMGIADPDAVGIQGHSWGGYQTAFAVTQTNIFKAAVSGAPVSNMTSAYSGIRHGSGLARQFQYETGQSRIGSSLFSSPQKYIENSPVFYAERIQTPMMIMFGDKDDAVPWEQGVEMYLAMRRTGKDVVFLQYQDEPHHLKKYPNKLDYSIKMMEYFEHYLKGKPAPLWLSEGEAYQEYQ